MEVGDAVLGEEADEVESLDGVFARGGGEDGAVIYIYFKWMFGGCWGCRDACELVSLV